MCHLQQQHQRVGSASDVATRDGCSYPQDEPSQDGRKRPASRVPDPGAGKGAGVLRLRLDAAAGGHQLDPSQFGAIKNSSAVHALVDLVHDWSVATDSSDQMVRALLLDYRKAFDLIDHHILLRKLGQLGLPEFIVSWVGAFLWRGF